MLKILFLIFYFLYSSNFLFCSEDDLSFLNKQNQLDYFVIRFEVDNKQEENEINELLKNNFTQKEDDRSQKYIHLALGDSKALKRANIDFNNDFIENRLYILFNHFYQKDDLEKFNIDDNFIANKDIFIPLMPKFDCFEISFHSYKKHSKIMVIKPGKKYIIRFERFSNDISDIKVAIQDIQENQLKVKNVLNEVLQNVPTDINKLISEYIV